MPADDAQKQLLSDLYTLLERTSHTKISVPKRLLISDLYILLKQDHLINRRKTVADINYRWEHLQPTFGNCLAREFDPDLVDRMASGGETAVCVIEGVGEQTDADACLIAAAPTREAALQAA
jgi:hypothetical protein